MSSSSSPSPSSDPFLAYPHLTPDEFASVAARLDARYRAAVFASPAQRRRWVLRLCTALNTAPFAPDGPEYVTYVQIVRPLDLAAAADDRGLAEGLGELSFREGMAADREMVEAEMADEGQVNLEFVAPEEQGPQVRYEIHLHPTYQAPCLWFSLHGLPAGERALDVDTVFRRLVPEQYRDGLRGSVGGIGGISVDHHPITGVPSFFIHPCFLGEAMEKFSCSKENYLMVWLGLVGGCVGLWVPAEMALES